MFFNDDLNFHKFGSSCGFSRDSDPFKADRRAGVQKSIIPDFHKPGWQDMLQKPSDKFQNIQLQVRQRLLFTFLYLKDIVGFSTLIIRAFNKAVIRRRPDKGLMIHSDRGVQYASKEFRKNLKSHGFIQSMSRKGDCWDNAVAESFFHTLKTQLIHHVRLKTFEEAEKNLFKYIEIYYNQRRKHSANGWKTPAHCEQAWYNLKNVA